MGSCVDSCSGGAGGGVLFVFAGSVALDGEIASDGTTGELAGGGGAGGSIFIRSNNFSGNGSLSVCGGDGGYSGGWAAGGGGSGGRLSIFARSCAFEGDFVITGGQTKVTADRLQSTFAGSGTLYVNLNNTVQALVARDRILNNFINNIVKRISANISDDVSSLEYRGAYVIEDIETDFDNQVHDATCNIDLHIVGNAAMTISAMTKLNTKSPTGSPARVPIRMETTGARPSAPHQVPT